MSVGLPVAVVGAGRIGRQHAKWYQVLGCRVVGFLGSTPESVARTAAALQSMLDRPVPGYTDFTQLVEEAGPRAVSICSPHGCHVAHTLQALEAGLHVLCEKPLAWDDTKTPAEILADGRRVVNAAAASDVVFSMVAQYVAGIPAYTEWYERERGPLEAVERFEAVMQSRGREGGTRFGRIWVDLAPHPLALLLKWVPEPHLDEGSIQCRVREREVAADFRVVSPTGSACACTIRLGNVPEGALERSFGVNGFRLECSGRNDAQGIFRAVLRRAGCEREYPDFLHAHLAAFVAAVEGRGEPPVPATEAYRNLEMQVAILERGVVE